MHKYILLVHILAATVWTGGHLVLAFTVLPKALKERSPERLLSFEAAYERIGLPALIIQVVTGLMLAHTYMPSVSLWFSWDNPVSKLIQMKLGLLALTVAFAADARLRIIPKLRPENMVSLAFHIIPVTIIAVLFVVVGLSFRTGGFP